MSLQTNEVQTNLIRWWSTILFHCQEMVNLWIASLQKFIGDANKF